MPVYRGQLLNERVQIFAPTMTDDGMCGVYPEYTLVVPCYLCRLYFSEEEKFRQDTGRERTGAWVMFGRPCVDIQEEYKVVRQNGQGFIITSLRRPYDGRVEHHLRALMRKIEGVSSTH